MFKAAVFYLSFPFCTTLIAKKRKASSWSRGIQPEQDR
jgi:hypothetical protein